MYQIKTLNPIAQVGLTQFDAKKYHISDDIAQPDAILVRSCKMHDMPIPNSVQVVGRAGAGTNNIPIMALAERGIPVLNTPGANANAVKELVLTGLLLASRNICRAWDYARHLEGNDPEINQQVEKNKKQFSGIELPGRTLGVIGLGHIGVQVANAAHVLGMDVIGYDPAITVKNAWKLSSSVMQAEQLGQALARSDFISLHIPLNDHTKNLIDAAKIKLMKSGAVLLNFARDGIIDNKALLDALNSGHVKNYVSDFPNTVFKTHPQVINLPHLGASTKEAEENCAKMIAEQVQDYLENGHIKYSVNFPDVKMARTEGYRLAIANRNVPNMVAQISGVLSKTGHNILDMINKSRGDFAYTLIDVNEAVNDATLADILKIDGVIRARRL